MVKEEGRKEGKREEDRIEKCKERKRIRIRRKKKEVKGEKSAGTTGGGEKGRTGLKRAKEARCYALYIRGVEKKEDTKRKDTQ